MHRLWRQGSPWLRLGAVVLSCAGCASLTGQDETSETLREAILAAMQRELADARASPSPRVTTRQVDLAQLGIPEPVIAELGQMAGPASYAGATLPAEQDLLGRPRRTVAISLQRAVQTAAEHNLELQFARLAPAISEAQVVAAEAAFDWTLFSNLDWESRDAPQPTPLVFNPATGTLTRTGSEADVRQTITSTTGLRRLLDSGATVTLQQELVYSDVRSPGIDLLPDPSGRATLAMQLDQPLLRNFGSDVALAQVRLNRNAERAAIAQLKADLIRIVSETEQAYWDLLRAQRDLLILKRLEQRGIEVRDQIRARVDAGLGKPAEFYDAAARVEERRANVLRAQNALAAASDRLKLLLNDPDLTLGSDVLVLPVDEPVDEPIQFGLLDAITTAVQGRPELQQALLSIDDTSIRRRLADNARLPQLNLRLQTRLAALETNLGEAYGETFDGQFVDYLVGLAFEQPIGNRAAEALYRQRRLETMQAVAAYVNTVRQVVAEVITALRNVQTNYHLIEQTRVSRVAAAESLRSFLIQKEETEGYTIELLNLELNRQEALAQRERDEVQALVDYMDAITDLHAAMGTTLERNRIRFVVPDVDDVHEPVRWSGWSEANREAP